MVHIWNPQMSTIVYLTRFSPSSKFDNWTRNQKYSVLGKPKYTETLLEIKLPPAPITYFFESWMSVTFKVGTDLGCRGVLTIPICCLIHSFWCNFYIYVVMWYWWKILYFMPKIVF
jgi:hypothetical protein